MTPSQWLGTSLREQERKILTLLLALSLVRGMIYSAVIPPWQGPDEPKHFEYIRLVYEKRRLITLQDQSELLQQEIIRSMLDYNFPRLGHGRIDWDSPPQSFQDIWPVSPTMLLAPPLYFIVASLTQPFGGDAVALQLYMARVVSVICGTLIVIFVFLTTREIFPGDLFMAVGVPVFVVFLPMHTFIASVVINDNLANLLSATAIYLMVCLTKKGLAFWRIVGLAIVIMLGIFTKRTSLLTIPLAGVALLLSVYERIFILLRRWWCWLLIVIMLLTIVIIVASFSKSIRVALSQQIQVAYATLIRYAFYSPSHLKLVLATLVDPGTWPTLSLPACTIFKSFWAYFGWMSVPLAPVWYQLLAIACLVSSAGLFKCFFRALSRSPVSDVRCRRALLLLILSVILVVVAAISFFSPWSSGPSQNLPQGRYLFPALVPIAILFVLGLRELTPDCYAQQGVLALIVTLIAFDFMCLAGYIIPYFYYR